MTQLKNWFKKKDDSDYISYHHKKHGRFKQVNISKFNDAYTGKKVWAVRLLTSGKNMPNDVNVLQKGSAKKESMKYAMGYMRNH